MHHPDADRYCVVVARKFACSATLQREFKVISLDELDLPDGDDFFYQYNILELSTSIKPWVFQRLLDCGYDSVLYIDPDIYVYRPLTEVFQLLDKEADVVLTPHLLMPMTGQRRPDELELRRMGVYNLGFFAGKNTGNFRSLLRWWQKKLHYNCELSLDKGIFVDQSWCDLIPGMFDRVVVLRHPGYNVAYWNLPERDITCNDDGSLFAAGEPLVFFHFSSFDPGNTQKLTKWHTRQVTDTVIRDLMQGYAQAVRLNDWASCVNQSYDFGCYTDGSIISDVERVRFRRDTVIRQACKGDPFNQPDLLKLKPRDAAEWYNSAGPFFALRNVASLQSLADELLGRAATPEELYAWLPELNSRRGMLRLLISIGFSRDARRTPGWLARLVHFFNHSPSAPVAIKKCFVGPLEYGLELSAYFCSRLAYRPSQRFDCSPQPIPRVRSKYLIPRDITSSEEIHNEFAGVNIIGCLSAEIGIGEAARSLARACTETGVSFSALDIGFLFSGHGVCDNSDLSGTDNINFPIDILYVNADVTPLTVQHLRKIGHHAGYRIGFWAWEQSVLPKRFHGAFADVDEIWVPSTFVQDAIAPVSPVPVVRIPHAVQVFPASDASRATFGLPADKLLVLVMYDFHSYQYRKNPQAALAAFRLAAASEPSLALVIKTMNGEHHPRAAEELRAAVEDLPHVTLIDTCLSRQQTWDLEACCDILLSLHRAEGFGLAPAEMMYLGKPVVATGWSANMDFMDASNSMPVRYELKPLPYNLGPYEAGIPWAEADIEHAAWCLRRLAAEHDFSCRLGDQARDTIRCLLAPEVVGEQIKKRLNTLSYWYPHARREQQLMDCERWKKL